MNVITMQNTETAALKTSREAEAIATLRAVIKDLDELEQQYADKPGNPYARGLAEVRGKLMNAISHLSEGTAADAQGLNR